MPSFSQRTVRGVRYIRDNQTGQEMPEAQFNSYYSNIYGQQQTAQQQQAQAQNGQLAGTAGALAGMAGTKYLAGKLFAEKGTEKLAEEGVKQGVSNLAQNQAQNEAYNQLGTQATNQAAQGVEQAGFFNNLGASGMSPMQGGLGAIGAAAYLNNIYEGGWKDIASGKGKSENYANLFLDINPVTAPINMISRALGGKSVGRMLFGHQTRVEDGRFANLSKKGVSGWANQKFKGDDNKYYSTSDKANDANFQGFDSSGNWINNKFKNSRNVADLKGNDTAGYAMWGETLGNDYFDKLNHDQRVQLNQQALDNKLISEGKGTMNFTDQEKIKQLAQALMSQKRK